MYIRLVIRPPTGAIEKLAKEDPRRARTGQILDDRIAAKRSDLRKTKKAKNAKATAPANTTADSGGGEQQAEQPEGGVSAAGTDSDRMDEEGEAEGEDDSGPKEAGSGEEEEEDGDGSEGDDSEDDDDDMEDEVQGGLEEDNLREMVAGGRGKVRGWVISACVVFVSLAWLVR